MEAFSRTQNGKWKGETIQLAGEWQGAAIPNLTAEPIRTFGAESDFGPWRKAKKAGACTNPVHERTMQSSKNDMSNKDKYLPIIIVIMLLKVKQDDNNYL